MGSLQRGNHLPQSKWLPLKERAAWTQSFSWGYSQVLQIAPGESEEWMLELTLFPPLLQSPFDASVDLARLEAGGQGSTLMQPR